jgi:hemolysin activation/secretion protein
VDAVGTSTSRRIKARTEAGASGDLRDELLPLPAFNTLSVLYTTGEVDLDAASAVLDATTARTQGHYSKWGVTYSRLQPIVGLTSVYVRATGQFTSDNLDSYEKFPLGGPDSVRAYPTGEAPSDKAQLYSIELRQRIPVTWASALEGVLFYDWAQGDLNASPWQPAVANRVTLRGAGVGVNVAINERFTLRSTLARRGDRPMTAAPDKRYTFALSLAASF